MGQGREDRDGALTPVSEWEGETRSVRASQPNVSDDVPPKLTTLRLSGHTDDPEGAGDRVRPWLKTGSTCKRRHVTAAREKGDGIPLLLPTGELSPVGTQAPAVEYEETKRRRTDGQTTSTTTASTATTTTASTVENDKRSESWTLEQNRARVHSTRHHDSKGRRMTLGKHPLNEVGEQGRCGHDSADCSQHHCDQWPAMTVVCHGWSLRSFFVRARFACSICAQKRNAEIAMDGLDADKT